MTLKKILFLIAFIILSSCSNKITEGHIYITKKYYGKILSCDTLLRETAFREGSMLIATDSGILVLRGNCYAPAGTAIYINQEVQYRRDNSPMAVVGEKEYKLK